MITAHTHQKRYLMTKFQTVNENKVVTVQYSLTNAEGVVVREATARPVSYLHGTGALPRKLEQRLESHAIGDVVRARLLPDDAFGKRNIELVYEMPLSDFPPGETIEKGGRVMGHDDDGREILFAVTDILEGIAHLDGNHPLAGQTLVFEVEIQGIRDATADELRTGKVMNDAG
ncbi:MAG: FKBP-type peptidyl-prolyl cis-trans isomerase [Gammaproteobacteria bacterium]